MWGESTEMACAAIPARCCEHLPSPSDTCIEQKENRDQATAGPGQNFDVDMGADMLDSVVQSHTRFAEFLDDDMHAY
jgi:hypothetical protein